MEKYKSCNQSCVDEQSKASWKMDRQPVTRTVSFGVICGGTRTSGDFSTARRHSSTGIRALLWASGSAKSFGCSTDSQTSRENIFSNILTPDSIPQFTIPTLSVQTSLGLLDQETEDKKSRMDPEVSPSCTTISSSSSSSCSSLVPPNRKAERCVSDPLTKRRPGLQRETHLPCLFNDTHHCLDAESKAALSLPHLAKVTTPYGFVALSQSPQMASEETLLCQAGLRRSIGDSERSASVKGSCFHLSGAKKRLSKDSEKPQSKERSIREPQASIGASAPSSSGPRQPEKLKQRFYHIIKKHFM